MTKIFAGFDAAGYPGDVKMRSLWNATNLYWCGFYLGPRFDWSPHFVTIKTMGWGVAPIYTGKQPGGLKLQLIKKQFARDPVALQKALYENGKGDGAEAVQQARAAKIPAATILYFDVENTLLDLGWLAYYRGWSRAVVDQFYRVGLYTRAQHASWVNTQLMTQSGFDICIPCVWVAGYTRVNPNGAPVPERDFLQDPFPLPNPANAGGGASSWQHLGNFGMKWTDDSIPGRPQHLRLAPVDFNTSIFSDPGKGILSPELIA
jgi:Domain of unknown function (DUF1906)